MFVTAYDADPTEEEAPPEVDDEAPEGEEDAGAAAGSGAGAGGDDDGTGVVSEANAALFMDEVELDGLEDDEA